MSDLRGEGVRIDRHILLDYKLSLLSKNCGGSSIGEKKREINYPKKIPALGGSSKYTVSLPLCIGFAGGRNAAQRPPFGRSLLRGVRARTCGTSGAADS